jgi:hypothetical protein
MADDKKETVEVDNRPTSQKDLEQRLNAGFQQDTVANAVNTDDNWRNPEVTQASHVIEGNDTSSYRGVSPEYMNYASPEGQPFEATEGPEFEAMKRLSSGVANVRKTVPVDDEPSEVVGVASVQTVNTATSGSGYSAELVDAPADYNGGPPVIGLPDNETPAVDSAPAKSTPKATKSAAPAAKTSSNS